MRHIVLILAALGALDARAGTVTGTISLPSGAAYTNTIRFRPTTTPTSDAGIVIGTADTNVTPDTNGLFSVTLAAGRYEVGLVGSRGFSIEIPAGTGTNAISELVITGAIAWNTLKLNPATLEPYWPEGFWAANTNGLVTALAEYLNGGGGTGSVMNATVLTNDTFIIGAGGDTIRATNALGARAILGVAEWTTNTPASSAGYALVSDGAGGLAWRAVAAAAVGTPVFDPNGGTFATSVEVSISCATAGAMIYYTTNGSTPDTNSTEYSTPFTLTSTTTAKAIAVLTGYDDSAVASATFTKTYPVYYGLSASTTLDEAGVLGLSTTAKSSAAGSYTIGSGTGYLYFASIASWATPTRFTISGLDVSLEEADPYDNTFGTLYYAPVTVGGVSYRLFRSYNAIGGGYTLVVQ